MALDLTTALETCDQEMLEYFMPTLEHLLQGAEDPQTVLSVEVKSRWSASIRLTRIDGTVLTVTVEKKLG